MKKSTAICLVLLGIAAVMFWPTRIHWLKPHRWASDVAREHFKDRNFSMFTFDMQDIREGRNETVMSIDIDICLEHGELRILERHGGGLPEIKRPEGQQPEAIDGVTLSRITGIKFDSVPR